jgi:hypothetical protein
MSQSVSPDLVIEDDGCQHFPAVEPGAIMVYSPVIGSMHIAKSRRGGYTVKHSRGMLPPGCFFDAIASGPTVAHAIKNAAGMPGNGPDKSLVAFGKRVEGWMS